MNEKTDNREQLEAKRLREESPFINQVTSFAEYMQKEYINESDGDLALVICAADRSVEGDGLIGNTHCVLGGRQTATVSMASMMSQDEMQDIFRRATAMSRMRDEEADRLPEYRRRLRNTYLTAGGIGLWSLALIALQAVGIANWITTVSNLLLMAFLGTLIYREAKNLRERIERARHIERRQREDRLSLMGEAFMSVLQKHMEQMKQNGMFNHDDEEDGE